MQLADLLPLLTAANRERGGAAERRLQDTFASDRRLLVYGTLAPGECNHHHLAGCPGEWTVVTVPGRRTVRAYPVFTFDPAAPPVAMQLLHSDGLPRRWAALDAFEGPDYRRILVPVFHDGRLRTVANLYEARAPVPPA